MKILEQEMSEHFYRDYAWKKGSPHGFKRGAHLKGISYRILSDSYQKKVVIERYKNRKFDLCIYDSSLIDFRKLKNQEGKELWYSEELSFKKSDLESALVRDECDRAVVIERYHYLEGTLVETEIFTPHQILIARQKFTYFSEDQLLMKFYDVEGKLVFEERLDQAKALV
jgi:hypothetical protein